MLSPQTTLANLCVVSLFLAGCAGSNGDTGVLGDEFVEVDPDLAQLQGRVVDEELRAVNATLVLQPDGLQTGTDEEGSFRFVNVAPGEYELHVLALGFHALARTVALAAGDAQQLTLTLSALPANGTYHETFSFIGNEPCQWYVGGTLSHCTFPYTAAHGGAHQRGVNLSNYGLPPDLQQNKAFFNFSVRPDNAGIVSELFWKASSAAATIQILIVMCPWYDPVFDECVPPDSSVTTGKRYVTRKGTSPIQMTWKHPEPKHLQLAPFVWSRANVNGDSTHPVGIAFEQKVEFYNSVFYGAPPPEGFTAGPRDG